MKIFIKRYLAGVCLFATVICVATIIEKVPYLNLGIQSATVAELVTANSAKPASGYAWNDNVGWINFGTGSSNEEGRVYVSNNKLYGYAWGENIGWISMNCENETPSCSNYGVTQNNSNGILTGYAWGENVGWINFAPTGGGVFVTTNSSGENTFSGYAWGENIGWISFSGTSPDYGVTTTWTKTGSVTVTDPRSNCNYEYSEWTSCLSGEQTRTVISPDPAHCLNENDVLTRSCTVATSTPTSTPSIGISITPSSKTIYTGQTLQLIAVVTGTTTNNTVDWKVLPIETISVGFYGTITDNGLYTAPEHAVEVTIEARAKADPSKIATAKISVRLPPPNTPIGITLSPASSTILTGETLQLIASITGTTTNNSVNWTILPIETITENFYGTINNSGLYTAPNHAVEITIQARPQADATKVASSKISVRLASTTPIDVILPVVTTSTINITTSTSRSILDISSLVSDNISILGTTTEMIYLEAKKVVESEVGSVVTKTITTAGVVGGVAASSVFVFSGSAIADLLLLPLRLWGLLMSALGLKKRNRPWGTVYDSVTKQPIDPAYVNLVRVDGKGGDMSITDLDGRYGFLVPPGKYTLTANKTNYIFPSKKLAGKTEDALYNNLYFGGEIEVNATNTLINKNIPLDPVKFDWNEFVKGKKKLMKFYSQRDKALRIITDWIFRIGFVISVLSLFLVSAPYNLIIFGLYLVLTALRKIGLKQKALGSLTDKEGNPLSFSIIRVFSPDLNIEITNKVADKIGRYYCLVPKGKYYVKIERKNDDESYSEIFNSQVFEAENGIVNRNFTV